MCDTEMLTQFSVGRDSVEPVQSTLTAREEIPAFESRNSSWEIWPNTTHGLHTSIEKQPQRGRNRWLSALKVTEGCAKLADKLRTSRPRDVIQYGIDLISYLVKVLVP